MKDFVNREMTIFKRLGTDQMRCISKKLLIERLGKNYNKIEKENRFLTKAAINSDTIVEKLVFVKLYVF